MLLKEGYQGLWAGLQCEDRLGMDIQNRTVNIEPLEQECQDRTARTVLPGKNNPNRIARKGQPEQDCQERTTGTGLPGKDNRNRIARKGQPEQDCQHRTDSKGQYIQEKNLHTTRRFF